MSDYLTWTLVVLGLMLFALVGASVWVSSRLGYLVVLTVLTAWLVLFGYLVVDGAQEKGVAALLALCFGLLCAYVLLVYMVTYKFVLQEPFLRPIHPQALRQSIENKNRTTLLDHTVLQMPWLALALLLCAVTSAYVAGM